MKFECIQGDLRGGKLRPVIPEQVTASWPVVEWVNKHAVSRHWEELLVISQYAATVLPNP